MSADHPCFCQFDWDPTQCPCYIGEVRVGCKADAAFKEAGKKRKQESDAMKKEAKKIVKKKTKGRLHDLTKPWMDKDLAAHAVKVANRKVVEARIQLIVAELRVAEAELRSTEIEIAQHASEVEFGRKDKHARHK